MERPRQAHQEKVTFFERVFKLWLLTNYYLKLKGFEFLNFLVMIIPRSFFNKFIYTEINILGVIMNGILVKPLMSLIDSARNKIVQSIHDMMLENFVIKGFAIEYNIADEEGHQCNVSKIWNYYVRWNAVDYLPLQRVTIPVNGMLESLEVIEPKNPDLLKLGQCIVQR